MRAITFPLGTVRCRQHDGVSFRAVVDGAMVACTVPAEVLTQAFGCASEQCGELVSTFARHRLAIEAAARVRLDAAMGTLAIRLQARDF